MDIYAGIKLICGLTFFLFGMKVMSGNLEKFSGGKLEGLLKDVTAKPVLSLLLGAVITVAVQSSSAVTVMLVGLVNSGIMQFSQTLVIIFGANIGTTLTSWILALSGLESDSLLLNMLKPEYFSPILAFIGIMMSMFSKSEKKNSIGNIFVGFSILMYGMVFMTDSVSPLAQSPWFSELLVKFNNPILGVLIGTVVTAVIQSSAASIGILQALSLTGAISYSMAIPIVMGQNIGTCATSLLSAIGATPKAKRVAVVHVSIKTIGTIICLSLFILVNKIWEPAVLQSSVSPWGIALIHTAFNILITVMLMPFTKLLVKMVEKIIPERAENKNTSVHIFALDERLLKSPSVAVNECSAYCDKMCRTAGGMLKTSFESLKGWTKKAETDINHEEEVLDAFEDDIGSYLVKVSRAEVSEKDSRQITGMLHVIGNFERLGDHALNLLEASKEIFDKKITFSKEATGELAVITAALNEILELTTTSFLNSDVKTAALVEPLEEVIDDLTATAKDHHIRRLQKGICTIEQGFVFNDIMNNYERISDHCSNVAATVIEVVNDEFDTHHYLNAVKHGGGDFDRTYKEYGRKYEIKGSRID